MATGKTFSPSRQAKQSEVVRFHKSELFSTEDVIDESFSSDCLVLGLNTKVMRSAKFIILTFCKAACLPN